MGEGKVASSFSKTHSAPRTKPVHTQNVSSARVCGRYYCLPNQQVPVRDQELPSKSCTEERGKPRGTHPSHWLCSVSHPSAQRWSLSAVDLCSPFGTRLCSKSELCPSRDSSVTLPGPPIMPPHHELAHPLTHPCLSSS